MAWYQKLITLSPRKRGFHLVTDEILQQIPEIKQIEIGLMNVFIQHTSASLTVNENAAPDVRVDMETIFNKLVPEDNSYQHTDEGKDDMPAHAKCSLLGSSINIPISSGRLAFGTWQGIYLCEHRNRARQRNIVVTINGQPKK
jgi:secondary thiamine-phosphate synthase enzyme